MIASQIEHYLKDSVEVNRKVEVFKSGCKVSAYFGKIDITYGIEQRDFNNLSLVDKVAFYNVVQHGVYRITLLNKHTAIVFEINEDSQVDVVRCEGDREEIKIVEARMLEFTEDIELFIENELNNLELIIKE